MPTPPKVAAALNGRRIILMDTANTKVQELARRLLTEEISDALEVIQQAIHRRVEAIPPTGRGAG